MSWADDIGNQLVKSVEMDIGDHNFLVYSEKLKRSIMVLHGENFEDVEKRELKFSLNFKSRKRS